MRRARNGPRGRTAGVVAAVCAAASAVGLAVACAGPVRAATAGAAGAAGPTLAGAAPAVAVPDALPATLDPNAPFAVVQELVVLVPQGPAVAVDELVQGVNRAAVPLHGLVFPLPPNAVGVSLQGGAPAGGLRLGREGAHIAATVAPGGSANYDFTFTMSWDGGSLWLPVAYPTAQFSVLVPHGDWSVSGPGFVTSGSARIGGKVTMDVYTTMAPTPGALLPLRVSAVPLYARTPVRLGIGAAVLVGAAAFLLRAVRRRRLRTARALNDLIDAVAHLDLAHARGELAEETYLERRRNLLDELDGLYGT